MPVYTWSGLDNTGNKISGVSAADNRQQLHAALNQKNIYPLKIRRKLKTMLNCHPPIKTKHITHLIAQLAVLINANTPLIKALTIIATDESHSKLTALIIESKNSLAEGKSLSQTWQQYPKYFTQLTCSIINAGEQTGTLDLMLTELANHLKKIVTIQHISRKKLEVI